MLTEGNAMTPSELDMGIRQGNLASGIYGKEPKAGPSKLNKDNDTMMELPYSDNNPLHSQNL